MTVKQSLKPNLLTIVPPYEVWGPPAGVAALLSYMKANGCYDFSFLDIRLFAPDMSSPTYRTIGAFGESYILDIPDLPIVLSLLDRFQRNDDLFSFNSTIFEKYCIDRGINSLHLSAYLYRTGKLIESIFAQISDLKFVGFSIWTSNYLTTLLASAILKRRNNPPFIVAGGPQVSQSVASAQLALKAGIIDTIVLGEGEETLHELYNNFSANSHGITGSIPGTITYDATLKVFKASERSLLKLENLSLPDFDEMHLPSYSVNRKRMLPYQLSRGCTNKCSFCNEWTFWKHFRDVSTEKAVSDVEALQLRWRAQTILFTDSLLNGNIDRLNKFAERLIVKDIKINWFGYMRAQIDLSTAQLLRRSGCFRVFIGIESLSNETLTLMNKKRTEQQNLIAIKAFLDAGIQVRVGLIPGFPGDTRDRFIYTVNVLRRLQEKYPQLTINQEPFVVSPGQPLYNALDKYGLSRIPWSDEVIDLASGFSDIASKVWCTVQGRNQGLDRLGAYKIALSLVGPDQSEGTDSKIQQESLSPYQISFSWLGNGAWLGRTFASLGHIVGVILTDPEYLWLRGRSRRISERSKTVFAMREVREKLNFILDKHELSIPLSKAPLTSRKHNKLQLGTKKHGTFALGPFTIARYIGDVLWLVNISNGEATYKSRKSINTVEKITDSGFNNQELIDMGILVGTQREIPQRP